MIIHSSIRLFIAILFIAILWVYINKRIKKISKDSAMIAYKEGWIDACLFEQRNIKTQLENGIPLDNINRDSISQFYKSGFFADSIEFEIRINNYIEHTSTIF